MAEWHICELVAFGVERCAEAERRGDPYIVVAQLYAGSPRVSSQTVFHRCVVGVLTEAAQKRNAACVVLHRHDLGWIVSEHFNVVGNRCDVNALLPKLVTVTGAVP